MADTPAIFAGVTATVTSTGDAPFHVSYHLACKQCSAPALALSWYEDLVSDSGIYAGLGAGDTLQQGPIGTVCVACGAEATIFDPRIHGYDGILNGGCSYSSEEGERVVSEPLRVRVDLI